MPTSEQIKAAREKYVTTAVHLFGAADAEAMFSTPGFLGVVNAQAAADLAEPAPLEMTATRTLVFATMIAGFATGKFALLDPTRVFDERLRGRLVAFVMFG